MVSDMWPIAGYRLSPYIIMAGISGIVAYIFLAFGAVAATFAAFLCLMVNFAHAMPDVMIDGRRGFAPGTARAPREASR
jgi:hypothetical protein